MIDKIDYYERITTEKMTREGFAAFVNAAERSTPIQREIRKCKNNEELFSLAKKYGFLIGKKDLQDDGTCENINNWFNKSEVRPIKK